MQRCSSAGELLRTADAACNEMLRSSSSEFTEMMRSAAHRCKRARNNVKFLDLPPSLRRPYILTAYRTNHDLRSCLLSLFQLHNETVNVWTHLLGCGGFVSMLFYVADATCDAEGVGAECIERWPLYVFLTSATVCLGTSAVYHLFGTANEKWERELRNVDYAGIVSLIVGSCAPVVQYGFGDAYPVTRIGYMLAIAGLGAAVLVCSFTSWFDRHNGLRVALFIALALSGVVALFHAMVAHDFSPRVVSMLHGVLAMGATYLLGVGVYATHFPESLRPARTFDLIGSSHCIWHVCVVLAALRHYSTVVALWRDSALSTAA